MFDLELFEERAAIMEFDGGLSRYKAEAEAARLQDLERWQVIEYVKNGTLEQIRDHSASLAQRAGQDNLPTVQHVQAQENRPMLIGERN